MRGGDGGLYGGGGGGGAWSGGAGGNGANGLIIVTYLLPPTFILQTITGGTIASTATLSAPTPIGKVQGSKLLKEDGAALLQEDSTYLLLDIPTFALVAFSQGSASTCAVGASTTAVDTTGATALFVAIANSINVSVPTFIDSKGNVYTQVDTYTVAENRLTIFHCTPTPAKLGTGHIITVPVNGSACPSVHFLAFKADQNFVFGPKSHAYVNGASLSPGTITPTKANSMVLAIACNANVGGTFAIDSSFTIIQELSCGSGQHYGMCSAWKTQTAIATESPLFTFTGGSNSTAFIMSFGENAPTGADVSALPLLVLGSGPAPIAVSAAPLLVLNIMPPPHIRVSAAPLLALHKDFPPARISSAPILVLTDQRPPVRISAAPLLVLESTDTVPIVYEDPCLIVKPRYHIKISNSTKILRYGSSPLRETEKLGGFKEPRILSLGPITRAASDPITGAWPISTASAILADTDWEIRNFSETRKGLRQVDAEIYMTSKAQSLAEGPPRVLFTGKIYTDTPAENMTSSLEFNDIIGINYSLYTDELQLPQRRVTRIDFPNAPEASLNKGVPIIGGPNTSVAPVIVPPVTTPPTPPPARGVVDGVYVGKMQFGGVVLPPTTTTLADIVALLTASGATGTIYQDWGWKIGYADATNLQSFYNSQHYVPPDYDGLAGGHGYEWAGFIGIGYSDLDAWMNQSAGGGGAQTFEVVAMACHAVTQTIATWVGDILVEAAHLGTQAWIPQIAGDTTWAAKFGANRFTDVTGSDGVVRRYTLFCFEPSSVLGLAVAGGATVCAEIKGLEDKGDGTGQPITEYFAQYLHTLKNFALQNYQSGPWLPMPQFLFSDGVTLIDRINAKSFSKVSVQTASEIPGGFKGAWAIGSGGNLESLSQVIADFNVSGGCLLAQNDFGQLRIGRLTRDRQDFFKNMYTGNIHRTLRDKPDILPGFWVEPKPDWQANQIDYSYAENYHTNVFERLYGGLGPTTPMQDTASQTIFGVLKKAFQFRRLRDDATANAVAKYLLDLLKHTPMVAHYKRRGLCGLEDDVLEGVPMTHYNGRGQGGWTNQALWVVSKTYDPPTRTCEFLALDVEEFVPLPTATGPRGLTSDPVALQTLLSEDGTKVLIEG